MPAGNPPSKNQAFYLVRSDQQQAGAFGPEFEDVTRLGVESQRYVQTAPRGDLVQVPAIHFVESEQEAREFIEAIKELQRYRPVVDTGRGEFIINITLQWQLTK